MTAPPPAARRLAFDRLGGFPDLFRRYAAGDPEALRFFARDFRDGAARAEAAREAAALGRDRDTLADVLAEQNEAWGNLDDAVRANLDALRDPASATVVTGQQLGLFGGPLYTVYKAATAVRLARQMRGETGDPVVPVFWMAGEDHDFDEVRSILVLGGNDPVRIGLPPSESRLPVGRRVLGDEVAEAVDALEAALRETEFTPALMQAVRAAYRPGASMRDAFAGLMQHLFAGSGLVLISSDDARLKRLAAPVFRQEIERHAETLARLEAASADLEAAGFHRQVTPLPVNLFLLEDEGRFTLDPRGDGAAETFALRGLDRTYAKDDLLALLDAEPERFSPNVVLRPIVEDRLLPTAAYVAGPGETSYYAQLGGVYEAFGVPMPVVYPRASVTLVEGKVQKILDRYRLTVADLSEDLDVLHRRLVLDLSEHDVEGAFGEAARHVHEAVNLLKPVVAGIDPTLGKSAEATRASLQKDLDSLKARAVRAEKRNHDAVRGQLEKAVAGLYPTGTLQERILSALYVLNKYGPALVGQWIDGLDLDTAEHQVVEL
ncbi:MAG: bacillithiol biosynthesis cysteine-adding enzyme BshC [Bacteroidota bacterium]